MREEDITEIVTEEEAKAGGGFFRTSRGALRCARCRSCLNRQMKRRCDMIITSSSTGATPKPKRAHASSKPDANDANGADADGDDAPHKAFAVWQRRTLFAVGGRRRRRRDQVPMAQGDDAKGISVQDTKRDRKRTRGSNLRQE